MLMFAESNRPTVHVKVPVRGASSSCVVIWGRSRRITESTAKFCSRQIRSIWSNVTSQGATDNPLRPVSMEIKGYSTLQLMFGNILQDTATHIHILLLLDVSASEHYTLAVVLQVHIQCSA